jgi:membrane fusion protein (multidrug efflux system)
MKNKIYLLALVIASALLIYRCGGNNAAPQKSMAVRVDSYQVKPVKAVYYDEYPATVTALNQVELRPEVSGYITGIFFHDGQNVVKGMKLYEIDEQQYKAAYDQAVANLNVAKANLAKAQQDADRYNDLAKNDAIAKQVVEHSNADLQSAKMQVIAAENNVNGVQTNLRNSIIYAPFDGTIGISQVKIGSSVTVGQTLLNTVSSDNPVAVDFSVDEKQITHFDKLLNQKSVDKDSTFSLVLPDQSLYPLIGRLILMDRAVDPLTGTIKARLTFPNPQNLLKPGLSCNVRIKNENGNLDILIPAQALVEQMGEYFVFVVNGNHASQRKIEIGRNIGAMVVVKNGLQLGEKIVTEGLQRLRDNSLIADNSSQPKISQSR